MLGERRTNRVAQPSTGPVARKQWKTTETREGQEVGVAGFVVTLAAFAMTYGNGHPGTRSFEILVLASIVDVKLSK